MKDELLDFIMRYWPFIVAFVSIVTSHAYEVSKRKRLEELWTDMDMELQDLDKRIRGLERSDIKDRESISSVREELRHIRVQDLDKRIGELERSDIKDRESISSVREELRHIRELIEAEMKHLRELIIRGNRE